MVADKADVLGSLAAGGIGVVVVAAGESHLAASVLGNIRLSEEVHIHSAAHVRVQADMRV